MSDIGEGQLKLINVSFKQSIAQDLLNARLVCFNVDVDIMRGQEFTVEVTLELVHQRHVAAHYHAQ